MGVGIIVCGLNGSGKSTLGKALADKLGYYFIDNEDLYFPKTDSNYLYANPRPQREAEEILMNQIQIHKNFVFAAVKGNYGETIMPLYRFAVLINVPKDIRLQRVRNRSFQKFGNRMLPGGDLYHQEKAFFDMVSSRTESYIEEWIKNLHCTVIRIDGDRKSVV